MSIRKGNKIIAGSGGSGNGESLTNQNLSSEITQVYNWVGTYAEYTEQDIPNTHPDWVCYITDDEFGDEQEYEIIQYTARNVGDIFFTSRTDINLNGAVECNGNTYSLSDYDGEESIKALLESNKLPYISMSEYDSQLLANDSVGVFGWDGGENTLFRVPTLRDMFLEAGRASELGEYIEAGLPNITGSVSAARQKYDAFPDVKTGAFVGSTINGQNAGFSADRNNTGEVLINFDASSSSSVYGNSDTVQPKAIKYRAMIQLSTGVLDESLYKIENHALFDNRITNCVTYIPQDIKLEINSTKSVTIKAGTKVYIPNRFESDGTTRHFDTYTYTEDYICEIPTSAGDFFLLPVLNGTIPERHSLISHTYSGDTTPTVTSQYAIWYDTANNIIKLTNDTGATWYEKQIALPIAIEHCITANTESSISQVFNGFGYIENITFVLPGVTAAFADGFNKDGTYKNIIVKNQKVNIKDLSLEYSYHTNLYFLDNNNLILGGWGETSYYEGDEYPSSMMVQGHQEWWYNTLQNKVYVTQAATPDVWEQAYMINIGTLTKLGANVNITEFKVNKTLKILNYNDTEYIAHQAMPSDKYIDLTLGSSGTSYTAPADGYVWASGIATTNGSDLNISDNTATYNQSISSAANQGLNVQIVVRKGRKFSVGFSNVTLTRIRFSYAEGSK